MKNALICILVLIIIVLCGYIVYDRVWLDKENDNVVEDESNVFNERVSNDIAGGQIDDDEFSVTGINKKIPFTDSVCLAIGWVTEENKDEIIDDYFSSSEVYESLEVIEIGSSHEFVVVPRKSGGAINIWSCKIDDDGNVLKDTLIESKKNSDGIVLKTSEIEIPSIIVEYIDESSYEVVYPIQFSGRDGTLDLSGLEADIMDITIY